MPNTCNIFTLHTTGWECDFHGRKSHFHALETDFHARKTDFHSREREEEAHFRVTHGNQGLLNNLQNCLSDSVKLDKKAIVLNFCIN
jgi:hypothetical protein